MNMQNEAILKELVRLDKKQQITGRKNHKRLSELQTEMLNNSFETLKCAMEQTDSAVEHTNIMLRKYEKLEEVVCKLVEENTALYFAYQMQNSEAVIHHC